MSEITRITNFVRLQMLWDSLGNFLKERLVNSYLSLNGFKLIL